MVMLRLMGVLVSAVVLMMLVVVLVLIVSVLMVFALFHCNTALHRCVFFVQAAPAIHISRVSL